MKAIDVLNALGKLTQWPDVYSIHDSPEFDGWQWRIKSVDMYHRYNGGVDHGEVSLCTKTGKEITKYDWIKFCR